MSEYISEYYPLFGVKTFHDQGMYGRILTGPLANTQIKIFIVDTGFDGVDTDPTLPGVQPNIDLSTVEVINYSNSSVSPKAPSHGSLTAALVAAPINGFGIVGVCPQAKVYLGDVDNSTGTIFQTNVVAAINGAVALGVDIISISLGSEDFIPALETAVNSALNAGIYVFSSAGNSSRTRFEYPAAFPGVISVGSVNIDKQLSRFNTRNERVAIFAPGEDYYLPSNVGPVLVDGTSFSCPYAAGLWALHLAKERASTPTYKPTRDVVITILRSPEYLDNGTLGYTALADPGEISTETLQNIGIVAGAVIGLGILIIIFRMFKQKLSANSQRRAVEKYAVMQTVKEEMDRECILSGNCV